MKKVVTFSLWGDIPRYTIGAIKNAELAKDFYPDFECWFYVHKDSVPNEIVNELLKKDNVKIFIKDGNLATTKPMMWRYEAIDDPSVEVMMPRDTDTRIYLREKLAVDEWLQSGKLFHIMRDHPYHDAKIMGGMFGTKKLPNMPSWHNVMKNVVQNGPRNYDQTFLYEHVYPLVKDDALIHAAFHKYETCAKDFPVFYDDDYHFIGEYVYENGERNTNHVMMIIQYFANKK